MKHIYALLFFLFLFYNSQAQNGLSQIGARTAAMGYTAATMTDSWSLFNNPAGLSEAEGVNGIFAFENKFGVEGFNTMAAGVLAPMPVGGIGLSVFKFGDELYNEQTIALTYGNRFGLASIGARVNYLQYHIEGFGNKGIFAIDFGGVAELSQHVYFGAYIRNINQAQISEFEDERVPTLLNAGLSYRPTDKIILNLEAEKDIDMEALFRVGLEYSFLKKFVGRTGIKTRPFTNFFGLGFKATRLKVDYALARDPALGFSHQAAIVYNIKKIQ